MLPLQNYKLIILFYSKHTDFCNIKCLKDKTKGQDLISSKFAFFFIHIVLFVKIIITVFPLMKAEVLSETLGFCNKKKTFNFIYVYILNENYVNVLFVIINPPGYWPIFIL